MNRLEMSDIYIKLITSKKNRKKAAFSRTQSKDDKYRSIVEVETDLPKYPSDVAIIHSHLNNRVILSLLAPLLV